MPCPLQSVNLVLQRCKSPASAARFHEIQPQANLKMMPPAPSSRKIVSATPKCVPYPVLQENTLVLSNFLVVGKRNGKLSLMFR